MESQKELANRSWPGDETIRVRMSLHTGEPWLVEQRTAAQRISIQFVQQREGTEDTRRVVSRNYKGKENWSSLWTPRLP